MLNDSWQAIRNTQDAQLSQASSCEVLLAMCLMPLVQISAKQQIPSLVRVSDASEIGAGECVSKELSPTGGLFLERRLSKPRGLLSGKIILVESFAGLCSARVAFWL